MEFIDQEFIPVILGGDINTYSVARAFYEEYKVKSYVFGKFNTGPSYQSRFTEYEGKLEIDQDDYFVKRMNRFAEEHKDKKILMVGCGDSYVALASRHRNEFPSNVIVPYIDFELMDQLQHKELFYGLCEKHGIDYPRTIIHRKGMGFDFPCEFSYPVIVKPSNSIAYWEHPFETQNKVYKLDSREEMEKVLHQIYDAGYDDAVIIQDMVPGNDEYMRVLTSYSDRNGKVKMMCLGHVLLEEHTPHGLGNHAVIITEYEKELMERARNLLEDLNYKGFSNFDIKYDSRDGSYRFFEINTRQGRSNYYVTGSGFNVARYFVEDYIYKTELEYDDRFRENLWLTVPERVAFKYVKQPENISEMKRLISEGKVVNPVFKRGDMKFMRFLRMMKNHIKQYSNFKKYYR
ncbi:MAG: ATP-grasp domain-containing protein [Lentihominibacter sp.]|nr:ATP-grasp domain-containing protein [Lentihominibacter sp.]